MFILFLGTVLIAVSTMAQVPVSLPVIKGSAPTPTPRTQSKDQPAYTPTIVGVPTVTTETAIQNNGQSASSKQGAGGAAAAAAMAAMAATAAATCPACETRGTCPVCVASLIGAAASGQTGDNMDNAQGLSNQQVAAVNPTVKPDEAPKGFAGSPAYTAATKDIEKATAGTGFKVSKDLKTVSTNDGRTLDVGKSATGGSSGGMSPLELSSFKDQLKKAQEVAQKAASAAQDGLGTGLEEPSGGGLSRTTSADSPAAPTVRTGKRAPANMAGAYKDLNGDRIGVSVDSMFEMMHRRYRASSDREMFIPPAQ